MWCVCWCVPALVCTHTHTEVQRPSQKQREIDRYLYICLSSHKYVSVIRRVSFCTFSESFRLDLSLFSSLRITNKHDIHRCAMTCVCKQICVYVRACADDACAQSWNNLLQINQYVPKGVLNESRLEELWCLAQRCQRTASTLPAAEKRRSIGQEVADIGK